MANNVQQHNTYDEAAHRLVDYLGLTVAPIALTLGGTNK